MQKSKEFKKIHFIGIGGIGVSALARYYLSRGFLVSGSDLAESEIISDLRKLGTKIPPSPPLKRGEKTIHRKENLLVNVDLVVYSAAVTRDNPELKEARRCKIKCQTYAQALGELTKEYFTIAVSGTHGKSTTTAMIALILVEAGLDPTVIVGTKLREFGDSNFRAGKSKYLVIEADEYAASFLNYWPKIIVLTNIEEDHLDYYKNLKNILKAFKEYIRHLGKDGVLVANREDENIRKLVQSSKFKVQSYNSKFKIKELNLHVPGRHNLMNALAAISATRTLGISDSISVKALNKFSGTWRRFEYRGEVNGAKIFDDYGHHPTEIKATLKGAREFLKNLSLSDSDRTVAVGQPKLWCVFQPHQYQRTFALFDQFAGAFDEADKVILLPIYSVAGREKESIKKKVSSEKLASAIKSRMGNPSTSARHAGLRSGNKDDVIYLDTFDKAAEYLRKNLEKNDVAVIMGAGDVYKLTERVKKGIQKI